MRGQNNYTRALLDGMSGRVASTAEMQRYLDADPCSVKDVKPAGDRIVYRERARGVSEETQSARPVAGGAERALLGPNTPSTPGHHVSMDGCALYAANVVEACYTIRRHDP